MGLPSQMDRIGRLGTKSQAIDLSEYQLREVRLTAQSNSFRAEHLFLTDTLKTSQLAQDIHATAIENPLPGGIHVSSRVQTRTAKAIQRIWVQPPEKAQSWATQFRHLVNTAVRRDKARAC